MGSSGRPPPRTPPNIFPADLTLSLSLAGPFGQNEPVAALGDEVENGSEGHGGIRGGGLRSGEAMEISSENMGQGSQSGGAWSGEEASHEDAGGNKRRKSCHKHTPEQIRILEAAFKESPHPDEKQRQQLSEQLGLSASQVKFWFQNRRCQTKVTQERHENSLLMHQENTKLKAEVERLHMALENNTATFLTSSSCSMGGIQIRSRNSLDDHVDVGHDDKTKFLELARRALDELTMMCSSGEPLWVRSIETGRDDLNYNEYGRLFRHHDDDSGDRQGVWSVEVSRETAVVYGGVTQLVHTFMDVNQWKEMFPSMVTKASTLEVIRAGESDHLDGIMQLMSAEIQTLTPLIPTRELHFLRHCKKLGAQKWAIVDVSLDNFEPGARTSSTLCMCLKKPSGCIVEEQSLARCCKVTWVENVKCRKTAVPAMYRQTVTTSGLAFGARRWVAALQLQCERMVFSSATNVLTWGLNGVDTVSGRQSVLKLAQRMTSSLYRAIGASRDRSWRKRLNYNGPCEIRVMRRKSRGEGGEPQGLVACAVLSQWLPVNPAAIFGYLLDKSRRHEWDLMMHGQSVQSYVTVRKGDDGNCVTAYAMKSSVEELSGKWILQDSSARSCESTVAYAPIDVAVLRPVIDGHDSSAVAVLPFGFVVMPALITSREEDRTAVDSAGSLVTMVFQALFSSSATDAALSANAMKDVAHLVFRTLDNIKKALRC